MNKFIIFLVLIFTVLLLVTAAHAKAMGGFVELYTTDGIGSTTEKTDFDLSETPVLYMKLFIVDGALANTISAWESPWVSEFSSTELSTQVERWVQLNNWNTVKHVGHWDINANYFNSLGSNTAASASFMVTPEPTTLGLFLFGGLPLFFRKKKV
ncbi:MAG: PEP-CTERM sorting domain-containing protein [Alphaproteobacteria bacterium]